MSNFSLRTVVHDFSVSSAYRIPFEVLLNKDVLKNTARMYLAGTYARINEGRLFASFQSLKVLVLSPNNIREFLHYSQNKWLAQLNSGIFIDPSDYCISGYNRYLASNQLSFDLKDSTNSFKNEDEDFCLFQYFPHEHNVEAFIGNPHQDFTLSLIPSSQL